MYGPINVKSPNNISKWQMGFNSAFKGLMIIYNRISLEVTVSTNVISSSDEFFTLTIQL
jgi:hypothetical protein